MEHVGYCMQVFNPIDPWCDLLGGLNFKSKSINKKHCGLKYQNQITLIRLNLFILFIQSSQFFDRKLPNLGLFNLYAAGM
jgi:hypothetical protein